MDVKNQIKQKRCCVYHADKCKNANNANNCWHFDIYEQNKFLAQLNRKKNHSLKALLWGNVTFFFWSSTQLSTKFQLLIKTKIPTNEEVFCFKSLSLYLSCYYEQNKFLAQGSWVWRKFYNLRPVFIRLLTFPCIFQLSWTDLLYFYKWIKKKISFLFFWKMSRVADLSHFK